MRAFIPCRRALLPDSEAFQVEIVLMHDAAWWAEAEGEFGGLRAEAPDDDMTVLSLSSAFTCGLTELAVAVCRCKRGCRS